MRRVLLSFVVWVLASLVSFAQAVTPGPNEQVVFENDQIRVLIVRVGPHERTAASQQARSLDIALTDRTERLTLPNGRSEEVKLLVGHLSAGGEASSVENLSDQNSEKLVVQFKTQQAAQNLAASFQQFLPSRAAANQASAASCLRTINKAQEIFAARYKVGFTDGLNRLGPPPENGMADISRANMLAPFLAGLTEGGTDKTVTRNGYRITYVPGPGAFGSIATYTIEAVPLEYGVTGKTSFYTDESAIVRSTSENRRATKNDPPL